MSSSHKGMDGAGHALKHSDLPRLGGGMRSTGGKLNGPGSLRWCDLHCGDGTFQGLEQLQGQPRGPRPNGDAQGWRKSLHKLLHSNPLCNLGGSELVWL